MIEYFKEASPAGERGLDAVKENSEGDQDGHTPVTHSIMNEHERRRATLGDDIVYYNMILGSDSLVVPNKVVDPLYVRGEKRKACVCKCHTCFAPERSCNLNDTSLDVGSNSTAKSVDKDPVGFQVADFVRKLVINEHGLVDDSDSSLFDSIGSFNVQNKTLAGVTTAKSSSGCQPSKGITRINGLCYNPFFLTNDQLGLLAVVNSIPSCVARLSGDVDLCAKILVDDVRKTFCFTLQGRPLFVGSEIDQELIQRYGEYVYDESVSIEMGFCYAALAKDPSDALVLRNDLGPYPYLQDVFTNSKVIRMYFDDLLHSNFTLSITSHNTCHLEANSECVGLTVQGVIAYFVNRSVKPYGGLPNPVWKMFRVGAHVQELHVVHRENRNGFVTLLNPLTLVVNVVDEPMEMDHTLRNYLNYLLLSNSVPTVMSATWSCDLFVYFKDGHKKVFVPFLKVMHRFLLEQEWSYHDYMVRGFELPVERDMIATIPGYCYRRLCVDDVDLGAYPRAIDVLRYCASHSVRLNSRVRVFLVDHLLHVTNVHYSNPQIVEDIFALMKENPLMLIGGEVVMHTQYLIGIAFFVQLLQDYFDQLYCATKAWVPGYCYLRIFKKDPGLGRYPTLRAVYALALDEELCHSLYVVRGRNAHVTCLPAGVPLKSDLLKFLQDPWSPMFDGLIGEGYEVDFYVSLLRTDWSSFVFYLVVRLVFALHQGLSTVQITDPLLFLFVAMVSARGFKVIPKIGLLFDLATMINSFCTWSWLGVVASFFAHYILVSHAEHNLSHVDGYCYVKYCSWQDALVLGPWPLYGDLKHYLRRPCSFVGPKHNRHAVNLIPGLGLDIRDDERVGGLLSDMVVVCKDKARNMKESSDEDELTVAYTEISDSEETTNHLVDGDAIMDILTWPFFILYLSLSVGTLLGFPAVVFSCLMVFFTRFWMRKKPFVIAPFGSHGDFRPAREWAKYFSDKGIDISVVELLEESKGGQLLKMLETSQVTKGGEWLADYINSLVHFKQCNDCFLIGPMGGFGVCDANYSLSPSQSSLKSFNVCPNPGLTGTFVNACSWLVMSYSDFNVQVRIGHERNSAPRLYNGSPLQKRNRQETGRALVCMGSSSEKHPDLRDLELVAPGYEWSSTTQSEIVQTWARLESRTDHLTAFSDYDVVVCHGGAGTMQVALSAGCRAISISSLIDRCYAPDVTCYFNQDVDNYWKPIVHLLPLANIWELLWVVDSPIVMIIIWLRRMLRQAMAVYLLIVMCVAPVAYKVKNGTPWLMPFMTSSMVQMLWLSLVVFFLKVMYVRLRFNPSHVVAAMSMIPVVFVKVMYHACFERPCAILTLMLPLDVVARCFVVEVMPLCVENFLTPFLKLATRVMTPFHESDNCLTVECIKIGSANMFFVPAYHVRLAHPDGRAVGVSVANDKVTCVFEEGKLGKSVTWRFNTGIPSDRFGVISANLKKNQGKTYHMARTCQTTMFWALVEEKGNMAMLVLLSLFIVSLCITSVLMGVALVSTIVILIVTGEVVSPVVVGLSLLFHAGKEDGPSTWTSAFNFFLDPFKPPVRLIPNEVCVVDNAVKFQVNQDTLLTSKTFTPFDYDRLRKNFREIHRLAHVDIAVNKGRAYISTSPNGEDALELLALAGSSDRYETVYLARDILTQQSSRIRYPTTPENVGKCLVYVCDDTFVSACFDACFVHVKLIGKDNLNTVAKSEGFLQANLRIREQGFCFDKLERLCPVIEMSDGHVTANGLRMPMSMFATILNMPLVEDIVYEMRTNTGTFVKKVNVFLNKNVNAMIENGYCEKMAGWILTLEEALEPFRPPSQRKKGAWAPVARAAALRKSYIEVSADAKFHTMSFDTTLTRYIQYAHSAGADIEGPLKFQRNIKRNPYIDPVLSNVFSEADKGIDGVEIATKELMIASLANYHRNTTADALTDDRVEKIAATIFNRNPELYADARMPDPHKLVRKYLSFKSYSAGTPMIGSSKIKTRDDLRKLGWMKPLERLATMGLTTGEYVPSLFHAFPKSQIVKKSKLQDNPAKLRSITGASPIVMLQNHMLHWDQNNRHDPSGMGKPGIPLNGYALGCVFEQMSKRKSVVSLDATAFDRNLTISSIAVVQRLREKGYDDSPLGMALKSHVAAIYKRTQEGYIINLISSKTSDVKHELLQNLSESTMQEIKKIHDEVVIDDPRAPGGVIYKNGGFTTGDSDVTFNNTNGLEAIIIDSIEATHEHITFDNFFDFIDLANFSDDNLVGHDNDIDWPAVFKYALRVHNTTFRVESTGNTIYEQTFLGKHPEPGLKYEEDFKLIGMPVPKFAVLHDDKTLKMRFSNYKIQAVRHTVNPKRHAYYVKEKCQGALLLTAHQPEMYQKILEFAKTRMLQLDPTLKPKFISYKDVLKKWYMPKKEMKWAVHAVNMKPILANTFEKGLLCFLESLNDFAVTLPTAELQVANEAAPISTLKDDCGIFEEHAWCCFCMLNERAPSREELKMSLMASPFNQFTNVDMWYDRYADHYPTEGLELNLMKDVTTWRVCIYTGIYLGVHDAVNHLNKLPMGAIVAGLIRTYTTALPKLFSSASYLFYLGKGTSSGPISSLMPKDPFVHHKRLSLQVCKLLPRPSLLAILPVGKILEFVGIACEKVSIACSLELGTSSPRQSSFEGSSEQLWLKTCKNVARFLQDSTQVLVAATGTGKTRYVPSMLHVLMKKDVLVVFPRRILCESYASFAGIYWKHRTNPLVASIMCCTYGYLQKTLEAGEPSWLKDRLVIFDEAHEWSEEWDLLKATYVRNNKCLLMTATPSPQTAGFPIMSADPYPPYCLSIYDVRPPDFTTFVFDCTKKYERVLIVEPSKRKGKLLTERLANTGVCVKHVHAGDRSIPEAGHIVATAIVDAGITIPGCDCVVDTCRSIYNDGGQLVNLPSDPATATQRAGRTGRTCQGDVYRCDEPAVPNIMRMCSLSSAVEDGFSAKFYRVSSKLERNACVLSQKRVKHDAYARFMIEPGTKLSLLSLYHKLSLGGEAESRYVALRKGSAIDDVFLLDKCDIKVHELPPLEVVKQDYQLYFPHYKQGDTIGQKIEMIKGVIQIGMCNLPVRHGQYLPETT